MRHIWKSVGFHCLCCKWKDQGIQLSWVPVLFQIYASYFGTMQSLVSVVTFSFFRCTAKAKRYVPVALRRYYGNSLFYSYNSLLVQRGFLIFVFNFNTSYVLHAFYDHLLKLWSFSGSGAQSYLAKIVIKHSTTIVGPSIPF